MYPNGAYNSGYAHGIAGVLGLLAKAYKKGIKRPGQMEVEEVYTKVPAAYN